MGSDTVARHAHTHARADRDFVRQVRVLLLEHRNNMCFQRRVGPAAPILIHARLRVAKERQQRLRTRQQRLVVKVVPEGELPSRSRASSVRPTTFP